MIYVGLFIGMILNLIGSYYLFFGDTEPFELFGYSGTSILIYVGTTLIFGSIIYPLFELNKSEKAKK